MKKKTTEPVWKNAPISPTCEVVLSSKPLCLCDEPTFAAYRAMGRGWMALCEKHAEKHPEASNVVLLIETGQTFG